VRSVNGDEYLRFDDGTPLGVDSYGESFERTFAPAHDFYGLHREGVVDIGAVEYR
jgi:hypothetical protein